MRRLSYVTCAVLAVIGSSAVQVAHAQGGANPEGRPQSEVASKTVKFEVVNKNFRGFKEAKLATDVAGAKKLIGKPTMFKGTVTQVVAAPGNSMVVLHFAKAPQTAVRAVVNQQSFFRFPILDDLNGKLVIFTAKVLDSPEGPQVELTRPGQLKLVQ